MNPAGIMMHNAVTARRDTSVRAAARLLKRVPVVRDSKLVGIVSWADFLEALVQRPTVRPSD
jgi:CBS domain-containing protein